MCLRAMARLRHSKTHTQFCSWDYSRLRQPDSAGECWSVELLHVSVTIIPSITSCLHLFDLYGEKMQRLYVYQLQKRLAGIWVQAFRMFPGIVMVVTMFLLDLSAAPS